ncbi:MAG: hypothetical protein HY865_00870 [Chloroflexi bacterium]|nr:hypothetical protein [Chloroflexota bacterium]
MKPTQAPWIVGTNVIKNSPEQREMICVSPASNIKKIVAITGFVGAEDESESIANASLIAISPEMLEALIAIQERAIANINGTLEANSIAAMISEIFEKLANEAGA